MADRIQPTGADAYLTARGAGVRGQATSEQTISDIRDIRNVRQRICRAALHAPRSMLQPVQVPRPRIMVPLLTTTVCLRCSHTLAVIEGAGVGRLDWSVGGYFPWLLWISVRQYMREGKETF